MAFGQTALIAALVANVVLLALFIYLCIENFQQSKAAEINTIESRKQWVDTLMAVIQAVLCLALVGVAVVLGYGHLSGF